MGAGCLPRNGRAEREEGNVVRFQILPEPDALGLIRRDGHVHAATMIESQARCTAVSPLALMGMG